MDNYNKETEIFMNEMTKIACASFLKESCDNKKANAENLSSLNEAQA